ncbi:aminopeptidase N [Chitinasiproducens palmae]|uniref:Aminopeptidase N n=1 Tax=Chitinasiproducens palmae TaxID=1770053 RepID=A0A1H2PV57_9BURK|nr:aminopeptidase N [Chitinasiproducens palmae]SDV51113.1 alanyl aminopeptidase. Metallo peptidase. MEROPS family M01 [Chitinasiproducens palmae]
MSDNAPTVIHRRDYMPPPYRIETVDLHFDLDPHRTVVRNTMRIVRRDGVPADTPLELLGEGLQLEAVTLDGVAAEASDADGRLRVAAGRASFELTVTTHCDPAANSSLMGLYVSNGNFFTQCEAEGFRKITYFLDRPDVMATYTVTLAADKEAYPVLLSNGNLVESGPLPDGRHYAKWVDPFAKPSYLFALVAGKLVALEETIQIADGTPKLLQVWVEPQDLPKTRHAMDSLIASIRWDERRYGLPLDLDRFMIVAVGDFNMGAMENKGLNIFNTKYVLADQQTATDTDFANVEAVVGHEYFHNWTGNRVTCRDWFQLSLKEGLTVFRDQEFSADMAAGEGDAAQAASAVAVKRIEDVRMLRQTQFAEDAGPMAHPVRPESYAEINNFYTVTVYEKGAEVVRMYQTLFGRDGFRRGMDLYFQRHDGQAVTCDDFRQAMADANGADLAQFERWYSQAGTPRVAVETAYDAAAGRYRLTLRQHYAEDRRSDTPADPLLIPFAVGLLDAAGRDLPLRLNDEPESAAATTRVLALTGAEQTFEFVGLPIDGATPTPSLLRHFSAPVIVDYEYDDAALAFLLAHDSDAFNRWEAGQRLATRALLEMAQTLSAGGQARLSETVVDAFGKVLADDTLAPAFREQALTLPSETFLAEQMIEADPGAVHAARTQMRGRLAEAHAALWQRIYEAHRTDGPYRPTAVDAGRRALRNLALGYLAELPDAAAATLAETQYREADNMTDRFSALGALARIGGTAAQDALQDFYRRFEHEPLVIDKWFALQAMQPDGAARTIDTVRRLFTHPAFNLKNPNRARSLIFSFCAGNPAAFHAADASGYAFWAEQVLALDALNPQVAARLARVLERWRKYVPTLRDGMEAALQRVMAGARSRDVREVVGKALG